LHVINPALVTSESAMIRALVEPHVDNNKNEFAIENSADNFKDYVKSYFAGTIASGLAYLAMIKDGYTWSDHFENIKGGNPAVARKPILFLHVMHKPMWRSSNQKGHAAILLPASMPL
jgi:hypothetical protein